MALPIDSNGNLKVNLQGNSSSGLTTFAFDSTNVLKVSLYAKNAAAGDTVLKADSAGDLNVNLNTLISGEDQTNNRMMTLPRYSYLEVTASGSTVVKSASGILHAITVNTKGGAAGSVIVYDNTVASGTKIATLDVTASGITFLYDVVFSTGVTFSFTGTLGSLSLTASYL